MKRLPRKQVEKNAKESMIELFLEAEKVFSKDKDKANKYVEMARKIGMKNKVRISSNLQKKFCKHCYSFLMPGKNLRVRNNEGKIVYYCLECKKFMRFPIKR